MNFLAHIYLSGQDEFIKIGNFMADSVKGKNYENYPKKLKIGILLHRFIDSYTDSHLLFRQTTRRLHHNYGHYSGVLADMFYDHFLSKNWQKYSNEDLYLFVQKFYISMRKNSNILTERTKNMLPYMESANWLYNYQFLDHLEVILSQMDLRTQNQSKMRFAITDLKKNYSDFESDFFLFFEDIQSVCKEKLDQLHQQNYET